MSSPGEFYLTGSINQLIGANAGGELAEAMSALVGASFVLQCNVPINRPLRTDDGIFYVTPRTVTVLDDGQISEDGEVPGIALLANDPVLGMEDGTLQWTISPTATIVIGNRTMRPISWTFNAAAPGEEKTLGELAPVLSVSPVQMAYGPPVDNVALTEDNKLQFSVQGTPVGDPLSVADIFGVAVGEPNGIAPLDNSGLIPSTYLPSYVDDVLEYANSGAFPGTGTTGKIYVAIDTGDGYRWTGSTYIRISDRVLSTGITDSTSTGRAVLTAASQAAGRTAIGAAPATPGTAILKGDGSGGFNSATGGTDYVVPGGALGTPSSGNLTNCTFPTLNQNTTGSAASLSATLAVGSGGSGATTLTGILKGNGTSAFTAAVAGTDYVAPGGALGTPSSGNLANCTFPTLNQSTTGSAATLTTARAFQTDLASTSSATFNGSAANTHGVTGTLAVGNGGSGATTLTGILKGNGTSAFSAAVAGTDYVAPGGALGTPSSGTLTNCTFPTLNQNTTGSAATLTTGRTFLTDLASASAASFNGSANNTHGVTGTLAVANGGSGATTLTGLVLGNGTSAFTTVTAPSGTVVGTSDAQTLTNKTLTTPKIQSILDLTNSTTAVWMYAPASAVNFLTLKGATTGSSPAISVGGGSDTNVGLTVELKGTGKIGVYVDTTGQTPSISAQGVDTNHNFNIIPKGTGVVQANGVEVVTLSGTQTLTNKTLTSPKIGTSILDTNGNTVFGITATASAVNYLQVVNGATGNPAQLQAVGSDTNIQMRFRAKGTSGFKFVDGAGLGILDIYPASGGVNSIQISNAATSNNPYIQAFGSDTNVHLDLITQGTGVVRANYVPVVTTTGSQTLTNKTLTAPVINNPMIDVIKDTNGANMFSMGTIASAVNYLRINNEATGLGPSIAVYGSDANAPMNLFGKGTSGVYLRNSGGIAFYATAPASSANFIRCDSAAAGGSPSLSPVGSDANINLELYSKGSGSVRVNSVEVVTISGTQTLTNKSLTSAIVTNALRDSNGNTILDFSASASAVNYLRLVNSATGGSVSFRAAGPDTNIASYFFAKGTGTTGFRSDNGFIFVGSAPASAVSYFTCAATATGGTPSIAITSSDANVSMNLTTLGTGTVQANGVSVTTISGTQTLTNKTISGASNTLTNIGISSISATGTPSSSTYLRGDGTWETPSGGGGGDASTNTSSSVDSEVALFSSTGGKTLKRAAGSGIALLTSGVLSTVTAPSGTIVGTSDTQTLTNKDLTSGTNSFPTLNQNTTGSAATLTTARAFQTDLASTSSANFNGSAANTHGVTGTLAVGNGGSGATTLTGILKGNGTSAFTAVTAPSGTIVGTTDTQSLSNKTLTNPTITNYTESVVAVGTVTTSSTLDLTNGTVQTATLTASTGCTFTMPTATAGKSFTIYLKQAASTGNGTATFSGVKWGSAGTPTMTAAAGKMDIYSFVADGTNWYGSYTQGYTP